MSPTEGQVKAGPALLVASSPTEEAGDSGTPRAAGRAVGQVRGVLADRVIVSTPLDPFLSVRALAGYSGLSARKLREHLADPAHPLPCYRIGGKIVVRRSEFDTWMAAYRTTGRVDVDAIVADVMRGLAQTS